MSSSGARTVTMALLTHTSIGPSSASAAAAAASTCSGSATSAGSASARAPSPSTSRRAPSSPSRPRAIRPRFAPRSANSRAVARPTPAEAPVMTTVTAWRRASSFRRLHVIGLPVLGLRLLGLRFPGVLGGVRRGITVRRGLGESVLGLLEPFGLSLSRLDQGTLLLGNVLIRRGPADLARLAGGLGGFLVCSVVGVLGFVHFAQLPVIRPRPARRCEAPAEPACRTRRSRPAGRRPRRSSTPPWSRRAPRSGGSAQHARRGRRRRWRTARALRRRNNGSSAGEYPTSNGANLATKTPAQDPFLSLRRWLRRPPARRIFRSSADRSCPT